MSLFESFESRLKTPNIMADIRDGLIGHDAVVDGPLGPRKMVYADYVASGRALRQIEDCVLQELLPYYANSHTEASFVGGRMTRLRREARDVVRACCNATADHAVVFTGSGATQGINRLVHLFDVAGMAARGEQPLVVVGPYEHHSNILPWRESGAEVIELPEGTQAGACTTALETLLSEQAGRPCIVSMSAASNVTGILADVPAVTRICKAAGARVIWDYAGAGPYVSIDMTPADDAAIDAIVVSPHKFIGGPQASGLLIVRHDSVKSVTPTLPGGGTVRFVSPTGHDYTPNIEAREEAGTPNVIGDLRAALCLLVKRAIGQERIFARNAENCRKALAAWRDDPNIELLGRLDCARLPIFSFRVRDGAGGYVHQQLITRMLSDFYGIQARGGCACAGPYVHRLLGIDPATSDAMRVAILSGAEVEKPGFVRLNLSYLASDEDVAFILNAVRELAASASQKVGQYACDPKTAIFSPVDA